MIFNYLTTNKINGKKYIGSHSGSVGDNYLGSGNLIKKAIKKYGKENFVRDVLNAVTTREEAFKNEKFLIEMYKTSVLDGGYNLSLTGGFWIEGECIPWNKGKIGCFSKETLEKMSISQTGIILSNEARIKVSEAGRGRIPWNKGLTKETDERLKTTIMGENHPSYGKPRPKDVRDKISRGHKGKIVSDATRKRMSDANKGEKSCMYGRTGSEHPAYGRTSKQSASSKPIIQRSLEGAFIKEWACAADVERDIGVCHANISACVRGKRNMAGGFKWRLK